MITIALKTKFYPTYFKLRNFSRRFKGINNSTILWVEKFDDLIARPTTKSFSKRIIDNKTKKVMNRTLFTFQQYQQTTKNSNSNNNNNNNNINKQ